MYSIYGFWSDIVKNKKLLPKSRSFADFQYKNTAFSYSKVGRGFPNFSIKLNNKKLSFTGGEFVKIKNRNKYLISPFKSTIPKGRINLRTFINDPLNRKVQHSMEKAGDDVFSLEERDVYYLVRGKNKGHQKICLLHGSFFETLNTKELIRQSFGQVLDEKLAGTDVSDELKEQLGAIFSEQEDFSRVRNVDKASVKLRFRILTEVKPEGNILNSKQYPEIQDDTLNFIVPYHSEEERADVLEKMQSAAGKTGMKKFKVFSLKHPLNGWFVVFQINL